MTKPLSVGVIIDLPWRANAGGHIKCWERFAEAAVRHPQQVDLTLHLLGDENNGRKLTDNVRYQLHPAKFSSSKLPFLKGVADHTDLARYNTAIVRHLSKHHLIHITHAPFALSNAALRYARQNQKPLCCSIHTDTPGYTEVFTRQIIQRLCGRNAFSRWLLDKRHIAHKRAIAIEKKIIDCWRYCDWIMYSRDADKQTLNQYLPQMQHSHLRRGIDKDKFHPKHAERARLCRHYGIDSNALINLYVGRLDDAKNIETLLQALQQLKDTQQSVHTIFIGSGSRAEDIRQRLADSATLAGSIAQEELPWHYASADVFSFPSPFETYGNVVLEAKASGLPVITANQGGTAQLIAQSGTDGYLLDPYAVDAWRDTLLDLQQNPVLRQQIAQHARQHIEQHWPSWEDVFLQDILPVWQRLYNEEN